jgi:hypothetical protein
MEVSMTIVLLFLTFFVTACQKASTPPAPAEKVDNPATRYADNLHDDTRRARTAADIANKRIGEFNANVEKGADSE